LTGEFDKVTKHLLDIPEGPEPLRYLVLRGRQIARKEELERRFMGEIVQEIVYTEAEAAFTALSTLLGYDEYFFGERYYPERCADQVGRDYLIQEYLRMRGQYYRISEKVTWRT
jgi:hypothetical protein